MNGVCNGDGKEQNIDTDIEQQDWEKEEKRMAKGQMERCFVKENIN